MTLFRRFARLAAFTAAVSLVASCDSRSPTAPDLGGGGQPSVTDLLAPTVKISLATGAGSGDTTLYIGGNLGVNFTATDNIGVASLNATMASAAGTSTALDTTLSPVQPTVTRGFILSAATLTTGEKLTFTLKASDASFNTSTGTLRVIVKDTAAPIVTLSSKVAASVKGGDSIDVALTATDSAGIDSAGFRLVYVRGEGDTVFVSGAGAKPLVRTQSFTIPDKGFRISDTLPIGRYLLIPYAADKSGLSARGAAPFSFQLTDATRPLITIDNPKAGESRAVGEPILVKAHLQDNSGIARVSFSGYSQRGDSLLGTNHTDVRYSDVVAPASGNFPPTRDTTISRYLNPVSSPRIDSTADTLYIVATVTDVSGLSTTVRLPVRMTNGPKVTLIQPAMDSLPTGKVVLQISATSAAGVDSIWYTLRDSGFTTSVTPTTRGIRLPVASRPGATATYSDTINIPAGVKGALFITPHATDVDGQPSAGTTYRFAIRQGSAPAPLVRLVTPPRMEIADSLLVTAGGTALTRVGYLMYDLASGALIKSDTVAAAATSFGPSRIGFQIGPQFQGKKVSIVAFAIDSAGRVGYSAPTTSSVPVTNLPGASRDTALVVYGRTYDLPTSRDGVIADLVVDQARGNVFLSNITQGRLEVWKGATNSFDPTGIVVGSQPWGMTMSRTAPAGDTIYVANSGGTNLSRVYIGPGRMQEDAAKRILTRLSLMFSVSQVREPNGRVNIGVTGPVQYSDRPQYVQQSASGKLYVSTKPTAAAPTGTLRYLDPTGVAPDFKFLLSYAYRGNTPTTWAVANLDWAAATQQQPANDAIMLCDHNSGTVDPEVCVTSQAGLDDAVAMLKAAVPGTDVEIANNIDMASLGFTDTTYVAASVDGKFIAFGEGHLAPQARTILLHDDGTSTPQASASLYVKDLINNASDQVFGIALDSTGQTLGVHGNETYFAKVTYPFEERLQGKRSTFASGAGIAFHPGANGPGTPADKRLAFVASNNGTIEAIDIAYYDYVRGALATKYNLYGALRVSLPFATDPPNVVLKLFGLSSKGLVIIDVTTADLLAGP